MTPSTSPSEPTTSPDAPPSGGPSTVPSGRPQRGQAPPDRRSFVLAGAVILGIVAILGVVATFVDKGPRQDTGVVRQQDSADPAAAARPHIIPLPGEGGRKPTDAGERGGWLQYGLAGILFSSVLGGATYLWWNSRRRHRRPSRSLSSRPRTNT